MFTVGDMVLITGRACSQLKDHRGKVFTITQVAGDV